MPNPEFPRYLRKKTLDDLLHAVFSHLLKSKNSIHPSQGRATEAIGVLLEITNPRTRLSRSETRGRLISCVGELLWYLASSKSLSFISYYLADYKNESDDGRTVYGAYGPRLFGGKINQVDNVLALLRKPDSRRAVIQLFDAVDIVGKHKGVPCTCTLQFLLRRGHLHLLTSMRSNDAFRGLPHDVFAFTMLQEIIARILGVKLGTYKHFVGSLHLYNKDRKAAQEYLGEAYQATTAPMPPMPLKDPRISIKIVLEAERMIRSGKNLNIESLNLNAYWKNLVRLLQIYGLFKKRKSVEIVGLKKKMSSRCYDSYIDDLTNRLSSKGSN